MDNGHERHATNNICNCSFTRLPSTEEHILTARAKDMELKAIKYNDTRNNDNKASILSNETINMSNVTQNRRCSITNYKVDYNIKITATEMIDTIIKEYLDNRKSELREVNRTCSRITERFWSQCCSYMEKVSTKLKKQVTQGDH